MKLPVISWLLVALFCMPVHADADRDAPFHFDYDIAPHLARIGCAAAECHGGATGRGGFKLSLFATNARADYEAITQELDGRRINLVAPHESLILLKPTKQMKHGGGRVIDRDDDAYLALAKWVTDGTPFSRGESGFLNGLRLIFEKDRAVVTATFVRADGERYERDVSRLARLESSDERVASIDENGLLSRHGPGETWILARYGTLSARQAVTLAFTAATTNLLAVDQALDQVWIQRLRDLGLNAAPVASDHRLLRRLCLDLVGRPPSPDEIAAYLKLPGSDRIGATAKKLLASDEFADQLARHLSEWFEVPAASSDLRHTKERNVRLRQRIRSFSSRDESLMNFGASLFTEPNHREFVSRFGDPRDRAEFTGRALLGISIGCARCHNHPMDRWSQAQHLQFSALFADDRLVAKEDRMTMKPGKFFLPGDGKAIVPALLPIESGSALAAEGDRSAQLARFIRENSKDAFARNAANRIFGVLTGKHLVDAPDDHRLSNPALHEPLLDLLATRFEDEGFRMRPLIEFIVTSRLYAMGSDPPRGNSLSGDPELRYLARREARSMSGDEFRRAVISVLGIRPEFGQTPDTPLAQQLHILNSGLLQKWLDAPGNQVAAIFDFETAAERQLEQLYLLILSRPPGDAERSEFLPLLRDSGDPRAVGRDLAFALLASREFSSIR